ncbi:PAS domain S-box protein [Paracrocinitomix mangrovi]|uniref:PAS domain S-box protein n=1 Tax=Paracrocinitomix mangrovi TaxID=2862509 RepID=UPI001C8E756D|nr:PAS domain S-box protein [Paracrocinitomix mangrovi]UKN01595.1 PAS domain S-box protein [Paracrocinitomix mangrovi]
MEKTLYILKDDKVSGKELSKFLKNRGFKVVTNSFDSQGLTDHITQEKPDLLLIEINLENRDQSIALIERLNKKIELSILIQTADFNLLDTSKLFKNNVYGVVSNDASEEELCVNISIAIERHEEVWHNKFDKYFLNEAQRLANIGHWKLEIQSNRLTWSDETYRIFGKEIGNEIATYEAFLDIIHPDDREKVNEAYSNSLVTKLPYEIEHRIVVNGEIKYVVEKCETFYNDDQAVLSIGTVQDITQRKNVELELIRGKNSFSEIFQNSSDEIYLVDSKTLEILEANYAAAEKLGYSPNELIGKKVFEIANPEIEFDLLVKQLRDLQLGELYEGEGSHENKTGLKYPVKVKIKKIWIESVEVLLVTAEDISVEKALKKRKQIEFKTHEIINRLLSITVVSKSIDQFLAHALDVLLELPFLGDLEKGIIFLKDENGNLKQRVSRNVEEEKIKTCGIIGKGSCVCHKVLETQKSQFVCCDVNEHEFPDYTDLDIVNYNVAITHHEELLGSLCLYSNIKTDGRENMELLNTIGKSVGLILVRFRDHNKVQQSESRFRELTETLDEVFWLADWETKKEIYISPSHKKLYEQDIELLMEDNNAWEKRIHPDDLERVRKEYWNNVISGKYDVEFRIVMDDGRIKWVHERAYPIYENGEVVRIAGYVSNITDKKAMEFDLKESEEKYRTYVENSADVISISDEQFNLIFNSPNNEYVFGYGAEEHIGGNVSSLVNVDDKETLTEAFKWLKNNKGELITVEYRFKHKNGEWIWIESTIKYVEKNYTGTPYFIVSSRDITTRKTIAEDLIKSEKRYRTLYNNNAAGLYRIDVNGKVLECNNTFVQQMGFEKKSQLINKNIFDIVDCDIDIIAELEANKGELNSKETMMRLLDGREIRLLQNIKLIKDENGNNICFEGSTIDTTTLMEAEKAKKLIEVIPAENPNPVLRVDYNMKILFTNESADVLGRRIVEDGHLNSRRLVKFLKEFIPSKKAKEEIEVKMGADYYLFYAVNIIDHQYVNLYGTNITSLEESKAAHLQLSMNLEKLVEERTRELESTVQELNSEIASKMEVQTKLQKSVNEKEVLLNEITHRVKNNLQVIASLLSLQKNNIDNVESLELLSETGHRIKSMALIHETLYRSSDFSKINFQAYLDSLIRYVMNSFDTRHIKIDADVDAVDLTIDTATSCGMIVMEVITNSIKYAFPEKEMGYIRISLRDEGDNYFLMKIADNGRGIKSDFNYEESDTLGMQLIFGLAEQLNGKAKLTNDNGLITEIQFQDTKRHKYE